MSDISRLPFMHDLCSLVTLDKLKEGFTIRFIAGKPASMGLSAYQD
jgi:hypothetical protein